MNEIRFRWRLRLLACCAALTALTFVQAPGLLVADTKYDLVVRPGLFLAKVLHLWDPIGEFGQVQNQAYGYLFPMGPFFLLGHLAALPEWVVQRAWWSLVLVVAFLGIVKLCAVLRIGSPWTRILAGLVFALSPRMLTNLGPISIENWPSAVAPWVLIPLVVGARHGSPRQAAARSALAMGFVGAVNAVASAAVVPISAIWLLTRRRGTRRGVMLRWWPAFAALATLWWLVPLLLLGHFSPPFLNYIESARGTTAPATIADALRGTTKWVPYVASYPTAGRTLLTDPMVIMETGLLVVVGLLGMVRRDLPERRFLVITLMLGVFLVTMGHLGPVQGFFAHDLNEQLDGVLAPLRNTHKWDVLIRLPLVLGLAHLLSVVGTRVVEGRREAREDQLVLRSGVLMLVTAAFLGAASIAFSVSLASAGSFASTPHYWEQAAQWLEDHDDGRRTYVAPGSAFGDYTWGTPMDETIQALSDAPWATRSVIPLVPGANIRMMDAIESRLVNGEGSQGLHDYLSRAGIGYVLVRNDVRPTSSTASPARVHAAIDATPGLVPVASFGPEVGGDSRLDSGDRSAVFVDNGWQSHHKAVEIYRVVPNAGEAEGSTYARADVPVFIGDSSTLLRSLEMGILADQPVEFARNISSKRRPSSLVLTDGSRRQEVDYGRVQDNRSASHAIDEAWQSERPVRDYDTGTSERWMSVPRLEGAATLTATSSASNANYFGEINQSAQPFAAVDDDPDTAWQSGLAVGGRHALTLTFDSPVEVDRIRIATPAALHARTRAITITTSTGSVGTEIVPGDSKTVRTRPGRSTFVTVSATSDLGQPLRISDLSVPGVHVTRPLVLPDYPSTWGAPEAIGLSVDTGERSGCVEVDGDSRCAEGTERLTEDGRTLDRVVGLPDGATYTPRLEVRPWGSAALTAAVQQGRSTTVSASSQATHEALSGAFAAVDGDDSTGWVAASADRDPSLTVTWPADQDLTSIDVKGSPGLVASTPTRAVIDFDDGSSRRVSLTNGHARFPKVTASRATVRFVENDEATSVELDGQTGRSLPVGVSELSFPHAPLDRAALSDTASDLGCGSGPRLTVEGRARQSALVASPAALYRGDPLTARVCGGDTVVLRAGQNRLTVSPTEFVRPVSLRLAGSTPLPADTPVVADVDHPNAASTRVTLRGGGSDGLLLLRVNQNEGWNANQGSTGLDPVTIDGWQQGWRLKGASDSVHLHFGPDTVYRSGLLAGLIGLLFVAVAALHPRLGRRGVDAPALAPMLVGWLPATVLGVAFSALVGGWAGLLVWAAGWTIGTAAATGYIVRRAPWAIGGVIVLSLGSVYVAYALRPWGGELPWMGRAGWPQLLALGALAAAFAGAFFPARSRLLKRIAGRSTT
jgi:arabinofuranan 3-O-arabinosyltransferase